MARLVRATCRGTALAEVARTSRAMTVKTDAVPLNSPPIRLVRTTTDK
jgi:hypothetical protein